MGKVRVLTKEDKKLADKVREIRTKRNVRQEELSILLDRNPSYMAYIETYRRGLSLPTLYKLSRALKVNLKELFDF